MSACVFQGAHNLDRLRLEGPAPFAYSPAAWRLRLRAWRIPVWKPWTRRQTLAEEHRFRTSGLVTPRHTHPRLERPGWYPPSCQLPDRLEIGNPGPLLYP